MAPEFLEARYANMFRIGFNEHELVLDFGQVDPDGGTEAVHTRIITAVGHGRLLLKLLAESVSMYEQSVDPAAVADDRAD